MPAELPILRIQLTADAPAYRQIADAIRTNLVNGDLKPGDLLPPVRQLAVDLGVHFNTVAEAYRILAEEGWLDLRRRRGAQVLAREMPAQPNEEATEKFAHRLRLLVAELRAAGVSSHRIAQELRTLAKGLES